MPPPRRCWGGDNFNEISTSPPITTDQLYKTAGWFEKNQAGLLSMASHPSMPGIFDRLSSNEISKDIRQVEFSNIGSSVSISAQFIENIWSSDSDSDDSNSSSEYSQDIIKKICTSEFNQNLAIFRGTTSNANLKSTDNIYSDSNKVTITTNTNNPNQNLNNNNNNQTPPKPPPRAAKQNTKAKKDETDDPDRVPQSMAEIYQLSNRNRKRNKEKKRLKEETITRFSNGNTNNQLQEDEEDYDETNDVNEYNDENLLKDNEEQQQTNVADTQEFLRNITWLSKTEELQLENTDQNTNIEQNIDYDSNLVAQNFINETFNNVENSIKAKKQLNNSNLSTIKEKSNFAPIPPKRNNNSNNIQQQINITPFDYSKTTNSFVNRANQLDKQTNNQSEIQQRTSRPVIRSKTMQRSATFRPDQNQRGNNKSKP
eukprot:TRINITY_DN1293_c0_g4_i2.p1 TRINITY_DN1293_c0_g4~~TRINITY_DN1293_c0_g4_i2.p1  ORF type:complete len:428 (+),score=209.96 TRINITY_DN1293_c0_g4_i2:95-1378(+)